MVQPAKDCPLCGATTLVAKRGNYTFVPPPEIPGGEIVIADTDWLHCDSCGEDILSPELDAAIDQQRYRRLGLLSPEEIRHVREKTGLSAVDMAQLLGVGDKTYTRWENGRSIQNKGNDTLIRLIDRNAEQFELLEAERDPGREALVGRYFNDLTQLKGENRLAMAAHGADMSTEAWEVVRDRLRAIRATSQEST